MTYIAEVRHSGSDWADLLADMRSWLDRRQIETEELTSSALGRGIAVRVDRRQRALVAVAAFTALKLDVQAAKFGQSALNVGLSRTEIIETVIQTGPYSGLAPALNMLAALGQALP